MVTTVWLQGLRRLEMKKLVLSVYIPTLPKECHIFLQGMCLDPNVILIPFWYAGIFRQISEGKFDISSNLIVSNYKISADHYNSEISSSEDEKDNSDSDFDPGTEGLEPTDSNSFKHMGYKKSLELSPKDSVE